MSNRNRELAITALAFWILSGCTAAPATEPSQRQMVQSVVEQTARAQINGDEASWNALTTPDGVWYVQTIDADWQTTLSRNTTRTQFSTPRSVQEGTVEHYWNERILLDGPVASFWAPYARQTGEEVEECGTVSATLVKTDGAWRVATSTRTKRSFLCQEYRSSALKLNALL